MAADRETARCEWVGLREALTRFVLAEDGVQGSRHISPMHWYVACRLVIEGGFDPESLTPRPPFKIERIKSGKDHPHRLVDDLSVAGKGERTILGGLKTKDVDVVVVKEGIGPCIAISVKGTLNAFRNLTNRMEEAVGDCTNLHIAYPALVYGFLHVMRANKEGPVPKNGAHFLKADDNGCVKTADIGMWKSGEIVDGIVRYHDALSGLAGRKGMRNDLTRYEAVTLLLVDPAPSRLGEVATTYPSTGSPLLFNDFFDKIYRAYDQRFIYGAPALEGVTRRFEWSPDSPALKDGRATEFNPRLAE